MHPFRLCIHTDLGLNLLQHKSIPVDNIYYGQVNHTKISHKAVRTYVSPSLNIQ
jgi:hypothetical protein